MQALALAPVLGVDAAALVGVEVSALRRAAASIAVQAAWRGRRGRVRAMRQREMILWFWPFGRELRYIDTDEAAFMRGGVLGGMLRTTGHHQAGPMAFDVETVHTFTDVD